MRYNRKINLFEGSRTYCKQSEFKQHNNNIEYVHMSNKDPIWNAVYKKFKHFNVKRL